MLESSSHEEFLVTKGGILALRKILTWREELLQAIGTAIEEERMKRHGR